MINERMTPVREYHLSADGEQIVYHDGDDDTAKLEYNGKVFQGRALYRQKTALGLVVSAQVEGVPDLHSIFLSVAVPEANRPGNLKSISVSTFAVFNTYQSSLAGPDAVNGQVRTYKVLPLRGNAW